MLDYCEYGVGAILKKPLHRRYRELYTCLFLQRIEFRHRAFLGIFSAIIQETRSILKSCAYSL